MRYLLPILALLCAPLAFAQPAQVQVNPDCVIAFRISAVNGTGPVSGSFDNRQIGCNSWQLSYGLLIPSTFSAVTLAIQSATDNVTFGTMGGTPTFGTNPLTGTAGGSNLVPATGTNFAPFVRVQATTLTGTGTLVGVLLGYRAAGTAGTSGGGGAGSAVNITQVASVNVASDGNGGMVPGGVSTAFADGVSNTGVIPQADNAGTPAAAVVRDFPYGFNGSTWDRSFICPNSKDTTLSGTGLNQLVALSGSTVIRICKVLVTSASGGNPAVNTFTMSYGTGSNCAAGTTELFQAAGVTGLDSDFAGALRGASANAVCLSESVANSDHVTITYAQF